MTYSVVVSVEGIRSNYTLTDSDLRIVFGRFGRVLHVMPIGDGRSATISFEVQIDAQRAINELDGRELAGVDSARLRVRWNIAQSMPPTAVNNCHPTLPLSATTSVLGHVPMNSAPGSSLSLASSHAREYSPGMRKFTCRFDIPIDNDKEFQIARRVIGKSGANMKRIVATTDAKLRLRGRGSGYLEGYNRAESPEPLHLCVSAPTREGYEEAVRRVTELLESIFKEYQEYCISRNMPVPDLAVVVRENPLSGQPILPSHSLFSGVTAPSSATNTPNVISSFKLHQPFVQQQNLMQQQSDENVLSASAAWSSAS